jgi:hypothetical protein
LNLLREASEKDLKEKERIKELQLAKEYEIQRVIQKKQRKHDKVRRYLEEEERELEADLEEQIHLNDEKQ